MNVFFFNKSTKGAVKTQQRRRNKGGGLSWRLKKGWGLGKAGDGGRIIILSSQPLTLKFSP